MGGIIACGFIHLIGSHREVGCHIGNEIKSDDKSYQTDDKSLHHVAFGERQDEWEEIEHTCQRSQWQELVAWQEYGDGKDDGYQDDGHHQGGRMTDDKCWTHTDVYLLAVEFLLYQLLCLLRDRFQSVYK